MSFLLKVALAFLLGAQSVYSSALDDYVWKPDSNYGWVDMVSNFNSKLELLDLIFFPRILVCRAPTTSFLALLDPDLTLVLYFSTST